MNWFRNMKIATKLISAFIIVSLIAGAMGAFGIFNMRSVEKDYKNLYVNFGTSFGDLGTAGINFNAIRVKVSTIIMNKDPEVREQLVSEIAELDADMKAYLDKFEASSKWIMPGNCLHPLRNRSHNMMRPVKKWLSSRSPARRMRHRLYSRRRDQRLQTQRIN